MVQRIFNKVSKLCPYLFSWTTTTLLLLLTTGVHNVNAASAKLLTVSATVISKNVCKFSSNATLALNFGALDPGNPVDVIKNTTVDFQCTGSAPLAAFAITSNDGLYKTGPGANRMRHDTVLTEYLKYSLELSPASGTVLKGVTRTLTITGTVTGANYQSAQAGNYEDTVILSLNP